MDGLNRNDVTSLQEAACINICCGWCVFAAALYCVQDVIQRGGKALPLYARVAEAGVPQVIVLPAQAGAPLQVSMGVTSVCVCAT